MPVLVQGQVRPYRRAVTKALEAAEALAALSRCRHKHGAVLIKRGSVIAAGTNQQREDPRYSAFPLASMHAEENVLRQAGWRAHGATLVVVRVNQRGDLMPSAPCKRCSGLIERSGIRRVVHT